MFPMLLFKRYYVIRACIVAPRGFENPIHSYFLLIISYVQTHCVEIRRHTYVRMDCKIPSYIRVNSYHEDIIIWMTYAINII